MNLADLKYTKEHDWVMVEGDTVTIGITDHAQESLGDVVFVELPEVDDEVTAGEGYGTIESVKAVSEIHAPVSGKVVAINEEVLDNPELLNSDPYGAGWLIKIETKVLEPLTVMMSADDYKVFVSEEG